MQRRGKPDSVPKIAGGRMGQVQRDAKTNTISTSEGVDDIGEAGDGANELGVSLEIEDGLLELGAHGVHGFECIVLEDFFADFIPEIFFRIELRRIGRKIQERDVVGNYKVTAAVVGRAVE